MKTNATRLLLAAFALGASLGCSHKASPHGVSLRWDAPPGVSAAGYNIYRSTTSGKDFVKLASQIPAPPYEDGLVLSGRTYFYVVTVVDKAGNESRFSAEVQATIP